MAARGYMSPHTLTSFMMARLSASLILVGGIVAVGLPSAALAQRSFFGDGIYLYGQSPQADELGREYLVFQVKGGKVKGAIYYPFSEFNCFSGAIVAKQMKLGIIDPSNQQVYPHAIALVTDSPVASGEISPRVNLEGYHRLLNLSENDRRMLKVCLEEQSVLLN